MTTLTENQKTVLHAINGTKNDHYSLARFVEEKGLFAEGDSDDMELSHVCIADPNGPNGDDFWSLVVGEIRGDSDAVITINPEHLA